VYTGFVRASDENNGNRNSCRRNKADQSPASDTNFPLPFSAELILVGEELGVTRRTMRDVFPYLVGLQLRSGGDAPHHIIAGTAAAFRVWIVPEYGLLNGTTDLLELLLRRFFTHWISMRKFNAGKNKVPTVATV
jgi:hypothetical protein